MKAVDDRPRPSHKKFVSDWLRELIAARKNRAETGTQTRKSGREQACYCNQRSGLLPGNSYTSCCFGLSSGLIRMRSRPDMIRYRVESIR